MTICQLTEFFMWGSIINMGLLILSTVFIPVVRPMAHRVHGKLFGVEPETVNSMMYGCIAVFKGIILVFFIAPWIALLIIS